MLQEITPTESMVANQAAQRLVSEIINMSKRVIAIRTQGIPAVEGVPETLEQTLPDGRKIPARPSRPAIAAISADAINAALGEENCALLDAIKASIL